MPAKPFPDGFLWGTATAAYQIEGYPLADGACPSIWHEFSHRRGKISGNDNGDLACDHYHRYPEDIRILSELGVKAYRFSIAWPRIFPEPHRLNPKGLDHYKQILDLLLEAGIEPFVTIFHWDEPLWLERQGGFSRRSAVDHFVEYGQTLFRELGGRVKKWISLNEPLGFAAQGYVLGNYAPGKKWDLRAMVCSFHHLLLGHSRLAEALHGAGTGGTIGIAEAQILTRPADPDRPKDRQTARIMDLLLNRFAFDALIHGRYPQELTAALSRFFPKRFEEDLPRMKGSLDFVGINYYERESYRHSALMPYVHARQVPTPGARRSAMWEIYPEGLRHFLRRLKEEYGNPLCYVTENGFPLPEAPGRDPLADDERIEYLKEHIAMVAQAVSEQVDCRGYFLWSLLDNFEWDLGYRMRFGIVRVDFKSLVRQWKKSAFWYQALIRTNGQAPD
jgi:beta-glucosidase